jgi:hypothetical protein
MPTSGLEDDPVPNLPTLTVTDEQAARLLAVFGSVDAYKAWLRETLKAYVLEQERRRVDRVAQQEREAQVQQFITELFPEPAPDPLPGGTP